MYLKPREKKREATRSYTTTREKGGLHGRERHPHKAKLVSNRYHLPLRPLLYPGRKGKETKMFLFRYCIVVFSLSTCAVRSQEGIFFFFFFFSCFIRQLFMVWDGKRG
jgi:hypothetical protein